MIRTCLEAELFSQCLAFPVAIDGIIGLFFVQQSIATEYIIRTDLAELDFSVSAGSGETPDGDTVYLMSPFRVALALIDIGQRCTVDDACGLHLIQFASQRGGRTQVQGFGARRFASSGSDLH